MNAPTLDEIIGYMQKHIDSQSAAVLSVNEQRTLLAALAAPVPAREWIPRDEDKRMIEQFCKELNLAHDELLIGQGCANTDTGNFDWPEGSPQASSIRWAERLLGRKLAKTDLWTLFPSTADK